MSVRREGETHMMAVGRARERADVIDFIRHPPGYLPSTVASSMAELATAISAGRHAGGAERLYATPAGTRGVELIAAERERQLEKWGVEHDADHVDGELAIRAAELAANGTDAHVTDELLQQLTIAGALIAAELDRVLAEREPATADGGEELREYYAAERERLQREHGGKLLAVWVRRGAQWYALASSGFDAAIGLADLAEMGDLVFGEPPGDGLWVWSGAYECRQTGYEEVEYEDVALGEWRRPTPGELARLGAGVEPWAELGVYEVSFEGGSSYLVAASTAHQALILAGEADIIGTRDGTQVSYRKLSADELSSTRIGDADFTIADMLADTTWPCVLADTRSVR